MKRAFISTFFLSLISLNAQLISTKVIEGVKILKGTKLEIFATQKAHGVTSPTALSIDEQGRVLVTETWRFGKGVAGIDDNRNRKHWLVDDVSNEKTADRLKMYQKWSRKHPMSIYTKVSEKIRLLEDTNDDGKADKSTLFADGFNDALDGTMAGIFSYRGNNYVACIPHIWNLQDTNGDGKADKRESIQDGFGVKVSYSGHDLNGFALGPDGRIYSTIGDRGFNLTTKEGKKYEYPRTGGIFRFEPDGSDFEVIHTGLRNPKEIAFDQYGNAISVDNNSDQGDKSRIVYVMEGGDSGWKMDHQILSSFSQLMGLDSKPVYAWLDEEMWRPRETKYLNVQPAFILPPLANLTNGPSGLTYHPGPASYPGEKNHFLITDYKGSAARSKIHSFEVLPDGAGMKVSNIFEFNTGAAVTDAEYDYSNRLFVTDFIGGWTHKEQGRIYTIAKIDAKDESANAKMIIANGFSALSSEKLLSLLSHPDMRIRLRAHITLAEKKDIATLEKAINSASSSVITKLHGIWGLSIIARKESSSKAVATAKLVALASKLTDVEHLSRIAQGLGEAKGSEQVGSILTSLLNHPSPRVQSFAAISIGRRKYVPAYGLVLEKLEKNNDKDAYLRHALVMGLLGTSEPAKLTQLKGHSSSAVQLAGVLALRKLKHQGVAEFLNGSQLVREAAIRAIHDLSIESVRPALSELLADYVVSESKKYSPMTQRRLIHSAYRVGGERNVLAMIKYLSSRNPSIVMSQRIESARLLSVWNKPVQLDASVGNYAPLPKRNDPVASLLTKHLPAIASFKHPAIAEVLDLATQYNILNQVISAEKILPVITDVKQKTETRIVSMKAVAKNPPAEFGKLLNKLVNDSDPEVALTALNVMKSLKLPEFKDALVKSTGNKVVYPQRQEAWKLIGSMKTLTPDMKKALVEAISNLNTKKADKQAGLEILSAAEKHLVGSKLLKKYKDSINKKDPLAPYMLALEGGNAKRGKHVFENHGAAQCMRCHSMRRNHDLDMAGPNLRRIGKSKKGHYLLEALVAPNATIAKGYSPGMPPMGYILKKEEIRDVVAYLKSAKK